jgi:peptidoglycan/LPS O-acetylase OafA/YrhL
VWPALIACVVLLAGLIGPLATSLSVDGYFRNSDTWRFLFSNSVTSPLAGWASSNLTFWNLPGLFTDHPLSEVNGSLWTIPYEVFCYIALFGIWFASEKVRRFVGPMLVVLLLVTYLIPTWSFLDPSRTILLLSFFLGSSLAIWQKNIYVNFWLVLPFLLFTTLLVSTKFGQLLFLATLFLTILWISSLDLVKKLKLPGDYSYGTYLWGWPVQQMVTQLGITNVTLQNQLLVIAISIVLGAISWHFVEKPSIKFGKFLASDLGGQSNLASKQTVCLGGLVFPILQILSPQTIGG